MVALKKLFMTSLIAVTCFCLYFIYENFRTDKNEPDELTDTKIVLLFNNWTIEKTYRLSKDMNLVKYEETKHNFVKGVMRFDGKNIDMFVHGKDDYISKEILTNGIWERNWIDHFVRYIKLNPGIQVLDVGCNLGAYTLMAAALGSRVIAIDANRNNTDRLAQSVMSSKMIDRVLILSNAVSNKRATFSMGLYPPNIGGQWLVENKSLTYQVKSIFLDDLLPLMNKTKTAMMKIDIEGHEIKAMGGAGNLFDTINIKLIFMEWFQVKVAADSYKIMYFFASRNYKPYPDFFSTNLLDISNYKDWPYEVVWRRP